MFIRRAWMAVPRTSAAAVTRSDAATTRPGVNRQRSPGAAAGRGASGATCDGATAGSGRRLLATLQQAPGAGGNDALERLLVTALAAALHLVALVGARVEEQERHLVVPACALLELSAHHPRRTMALGYRDQALLRPA